MSNAVGGFIRYKSRWTMRWALLNTRRVHHLPYSVQADIRPLEGRTVVVCGAGPSLKRNGWALQDAVEKRIPIITVNAGDSALRSMGIRPDVVIARESLELSDQAEATEARSWILDISSNPAQWTVLEQREDVRAYWYLPLYPRHIPHSRMLGVRPLPTGSSALNGAVSHAIAWGARRIILVGVDLSIAEDGSVYHPAAPRGDLTAMVTRQRDEQGQIVDAIELSNDEADAARAKRSGQRPQGHLVECVSVYASDWSGIRPAKTVFENQRVWLETMASPTRHGLHVDMINATERGAGILGWRNERLAEVLRHELPQQPWDLPEGQMVDEQAAADTVNRLINDARQLRYRAEQLLLPTGPTLRALPLYLHTPGKPPSPTLEGNGLVEALASWAVADMAEEVSNSAERVEKQARAWLQASEDALAMLTGDVERKVA